MNKPTKLALAFLAFAGLTGVAAHAEESTRTERGERYARMDADKSGDVSFDEFSLRLQERIGSADANGDGEITVEELAEHIMRQRAERQARHMIRRHDVNGDGILTLEEIESRQRKYFALLDRNDDGSLQKEELRRGRMGPHRGQMMRHHGRKHHRGDR